MPQDQLAFLVNIKLLIEKEKTYTRPFLTNTQNTHKDKEQALHELLLEGKGQRDMERDSDL